MPQDESHGRACAFWITMGAQNSIDMLHVSELRRSTTDRQLLSRCIQKATVLTSSVGSTAARARAMNRIASCLLSKPSCPRSLGIEATVEAEAELSLLSAVLAVLELLVKSSV